MLKLKFNHLTHLHDARFAAAMFAEYVGFDLERGSFTKLPERDVQQIIEWLEGPAAVLQFGQDASGLQAFVAQYTPPAQVICELAWEAALAGGFPAELPEAQRAVRLCLKKDRAQWPASVIITDFAAQLTYLELSLPDDQPDALAFASEVVAGCFNLLLDIDPLPSPDALAQFTVLPMGVAVGQTVKTDLALDFDKVENLIAHPLFEHKHPGLD